MKRLLTVITWPGYKEKTSERAMVLGDKVETGVGGDAARSAFFDAVYTKLGVR